MINASDLSSNKHLKGQVVLCKELIEVTTKYEWNTARTICFD